MKIFWTLGTALRSLAPVLAVGAAVLGMQTAQGQPAMAPDLLEEQVEALIRLGEGQPRLAARRLASLAEQSGTPVARAKVLLGMAIVEAQAGHDSAAAGLVQELAVASRSNESRAQVRPDLVRAIMAQAKGRSDLAATSAEAAVMGMSAMCPPPTSDAAASAVSVPSTVCDHRSLWRALQILIQRSIAVGALPAASERAQQAVALARLANDDYLQVNSLGLLALTQALRTQCEQARSTLAHATMLISRKADAYLNARTRLDTATIAAKCADASGALESAQQAHALAISAGANRLAALALVQQARSLVDLSRPAEALAAIAAARRTQSDAIDANMELQLNKWEGLALIARHELPKGKQRLQILIDAWEQNGEAAQLAGAMWEYGLALAKAGDSDAALDLYHRERRLSEALMNEDRDAVLAETRRSYDVQAKARSIDLIRSENALKAETLNNASLTRRIWLLIATVFSLGLTLALVYYRRERGDHLRLSTDQARLRRASQTDLLTGCANRRHFENVLKSRWGKKGREFSGALFLLDIDHFKKINDSHGHATGDAVLVEVAQRLKAAIRNSDLLVRWGGEEFLLASSELSMLQAEQLASRVLASLACNPIVIGDSRIYVTASIGYACLPILPASGELPMSRAIELIDAALYEAKTSGRNRAIGLTSFVAHADGDIDRILKNLTRAAQRGLATWRTVVGPSLADKDPSASPDGALPARPKGTAAALSHPGVH